MLASILDIVTPPATTRLTTLARVKAELVIVNSASDVILEGKIDEASSDIVKACGKELASATVRETFWHEPHLRYGYGYASSGLGYGYGISGQHGDVLFLRRTPISAIASVTLDDVVLGSSEYRFDADAGMLYRLDTSGYPCSWLFCKSIVVVYTGGFILPGQPGRNLEPGIEGATVELVSSYWFSRGRDGMVKSEDIPGVRRVEYWVGAVGDPELLPPRVLASISAFRRPRAAVA